MRCVLAAARATRNDPDAPLFMTKSGEGLQKKQVVDFYCSCTCAFGVVALFPQATLHVLRVLNGWLGVFAENEHSFQFVVTRVRSCRRAQESQRRERADMILV